MVINLHKDLQIMTAIDHAKLHCKHLSTFLKIMLNYVPTFCIPTFFFVSESFFGLYLYHTIIIINNVLSKTRFKNNNNNTIYVIATFINLYSEYRPWYKLRLAYSTFDQHSTLPLPYYM